MITLYQYCDGCKTERGFILTADEIKCRVCKKKHKYNDKKDR
jgi:hypothetical protein